MTSYRFVTLTCDKCGEIYDPGTEDSVRVVREMAKMEGWGIRWARNRRMQDWCGVCCGVRIKVGDFVERVKT